MDDSTREKIIGHYQRGQGSIQDIARVYNVSVAEVLRVTGNNDLATVTLGGDLIDQSEAGNSPINYGENIPVPFTVN